MARRTKAQIAEANARAAQIAKADAELYREECRVCGKPIPYARVRTNHTTCGGGCALKSMREREAAKAAAQEEASE